MTIYTDYRANLIGVLRETLSPEISLIDYIPDSIAPPAVVFGWSNPWIVPDTWCQVTTTAELIVVSQRIEPGGHLETLEELVTELISVLTSEHIAYRDVSAPYPIVLGGVNYLAASVNIVHEMGD